MTEEKSSRQILEWIFNAKMLQKAMYLSPELGQLTKCNPQMQDFNCVLDLTWSKGRDIFFNWLSILKNFVLSNGPENVRNVIRMALN